jgi:hypothetical protein
MPLRTLNMHLRKPRILGYLVFLHIAKCTGHSTPRRLPSTLSYGETKERLWPVHILCSRCGMHSSPSGCGRSFSTCGARTMNRSNSTAQGHAALCGGCTTAAAPVGDDHCVTPSPNPPFSSCSIEGPAAT